MKCLFQSDMLPKSCLTLNDPYRINRTICGDVYMCIMRTGELKEEIVCRRSKSDTCLSRENTAY